MWGGGAGERHRESVLQSIAANLEGWTLEVKRETAVYHTLNKLSMDVTRKVLVAEAWVPVNAKSRVQSALQSAAQRSSASVQILPSATQILMQCRSCVAQLLLLE